MTALAAEDVDFASVAGRDKNVGHRNPGQRGRDPPDAVVPRVRDVDRLIGSGGHRIRRPIAVCGPGPPSRNGAAAPLPANVLITPSVPTLRTLFVAAM